MKRCPRCNARFDEGRALCPHDGAELVEMPDPMVGRTLAERYKLVQRIGAGGMGTVYRARHLLLRRDVAVKLLAPELTRDPVMRARFLREAQTTSMLRHPNIVEIYDIAEENSRAFLVMELLEGASLASRLGAGPLRIEEAVELTVPVASALARAHSLGVVHRDIKPENVFVARRASGPSSVKVLDFGIAHLRFEARLTAPGEIFGTPEYLAPELARGEACVPASDQYALGVMLFELVTGSLPFEGDLVRMIEHHRSTPAPSARARNPQVPEALDALLRRLMAKYPSERLPSAAAVEEALSELLATLDGGVSEVKARPLRETIDLDPMPDAVSRPEPDDDEKKTLPRVLPTPPTLATLRQHRASFEAAVAAAHPAGAPTWVREALGTLTVTLEALESLEDQRRAVMREVGERERRALEQRLSLRERRDELQRSLAESTDRNAEVLATLDEYQRDEINLLNTLLFGWNDLGSPPSNPRSLDDGRLSLLESVGRHATALKELRQKLLGLQNQRDAVATARAALEARLRETQGSLDAIEAEARRWDETFRAQATRSGVDAEALYGRIRAQADSLATHLQSYPAVRGLLSWSGRAPSVAETG